MMISPFAWVVPRHRGRLCLALTVLLVCSSLWLFTMDRSLASEEAPRGIVSFELAGDAGRSEAILSSWSGHARALALLIQGADYLYLIVYALWFSLAVQLLAQRLGGAWQKLGLGVSWLVLLAAPLDAVENYALIQQLLYGASAHYAAMAWWCAVPKFVLVGMAAGFLAIAGIRWVVKEVL